MTRFNREDPRTVLPQMEKEIEEINGAMSNIGEIVSLIGSADMSDVTVAANSYTDLGSVVLCKGTWIVVCTARFAPTASGDHYTTISISPTSQNTAWFDRRFSTSTYTNQHNMTRIVTPSKPTRFYLTGGTSAAGKWTRNNSNAFSIIALRIK